MVGVEGEVAPDLGALHIDGPSDPVALQPLVDLVRRQRVNPLPPTRRLADARQVAADETGQFDRILHRNRHGRLGRDVEPVGAGHQEAGI